MVRNPGFFVLCLHFLFRPPSSTFRLLCPGSGAGFLEGTRPLVFAGSRLFAIAFPPPFLTFTEMDAIAFPPTAVLDDRRDSRDRIPTVVLDLPGDGCDRIPNCRF